MGLAEYKLLSVGYKCLTFNIKKSLPKLIFLINPLSFKENVIFLDLKIAFGLR